ncbi:GNAT family N-acetyltransferase [Roseospira visakhapatnamensis]|uniref:Putative acetyltransferase n=1 Tax=Roseospira visakhapatnamensis TaxID=390880 RepID=A0A7W6W8H7_9PROT|nr:N-acetyltransferase [Roseospira visakhapatnamensis]MBB4264843.1 putative acetyltransferase [Roseospira visakhapatnamensis]
MLFRDTTASDLDTVLAIHRHAFGEEDEAHLTRDLLGDPSAAPRLSLLAVIDDRAVGHILFTAAPLAGAEPPVSARLLAPLAVEPDAQGRGVGQALIDKGLGRLARAGVDLVFVLGHPGYYPRRGFVPAGRLGFEAPYPIPEKDAGAWMVRALRDGVIGTVAGRVCCADALDRPEYWRE